MLPSLFTRITLQNPPDVEVVSIKVLEFSLAAVQRLERKEVLDPGFEVKSPYY